MDKPNKVKKFTAQGSRSLKPVGVASGSSADSHRRLSCNWESNDGGRLVPGTLPLDKSDEGSFIWKQ